MPRYENDVKPEDLRLPTKREVLCVALFAYLALLSFAGVYGGIEGAKSWVAWKAERSPQEIRFKLVEPIVNAAIDCGRLTFDLVFSAVACAVTAGTAPISVPLLLVL